MTHFPSGLTVSSIDISEFHVYDKAIAVPVNIPATQRMEAFEPELVVSSDPKLPKAELLIGR